MYDVIVEPHDIIVERSGVVPYDSGAKRSHDVSMTSLVTSLLVVVARTWGIPSILIRTLNMYIRCTIAHLEP